jgi:serine/threonine protein phosphatase PrpC
MIDATWRVVAASVTGTSHLKTAQTCKDAHHWIQLPGGILVAAVADGAGSTTMGEIGAALAVRTSVESLCGRLSISGLPSTEDENHWQAFLMEAVDASRKALEGEAAERKVAVRELATTLILLVAAPHLVAVAQVGDGAVVLGNAEGNPHTLTVPKTGEYINETTFIVSPNALEETQVALWPGPPTHLAAFSDGLEMIALKLPGGKPHGGLSQMRRTGADSFTSGRNGSKRVATHVLR